MIFELLRDVMPYFDLVASPNGHASHGPKGFGDVAESRFESLCSEHVLQQ